MKDRQPFELKTVINIYNLIQIFVNFYMVFLVSFYFYSTELPLMSVVLLKVVKYAPKLKDFTLFCIPDPRGDDSEAALQILHGHYIYLVVKIVDLLDTVSLLTELLIN